MKVYKGTRGNNQCTVTIDGNPLAMKRRPDESETIPFTWGEHSDGAERLALSLLADCLDDDHAIVMAQEFMREVVSKLAADWEITSDDVEQWRDYTCAVGYAAQNAVWTPGGSGRPPQTIETPAHLPRLLINPNYRFGEQRPQNA